MAKGSEPGASSLPQKRSAKLLSLSAFAAKPISIAALALKLTTCGLLKPCGVLRR